MLNNIARIQRALTQAHLDAILLTDENDRRFATGFPSSDGAVIVTVHQAFFITDARYIEAARAALTGIAQVLLCSREAPMRTLVQGILREANVQILGGEEQTTSYAEFTAYEQLFGLKLQPAQNLIRNLRAAKQPEELAMMYQAQQITDETFAQICTVIRPGMTEREIAAELIYRMLRLGAEGTSFDPIVLTGPDTSMPHGVPGDRRVAAGDFVTMDFGCRKNGYCSDMTRTVAVGMPTDEMRSVYQIVLNAQLAGIAAAKAGVTGERVDGAARKVISDAGYGAYFGHSFGHGVGVEFHEDPFVAHTGKKQAETAAANFAAKEAFLKACGTGLSGFSMAEIAALRQPSGAPYLEFTGKAARFMSQNHLQAHLSLTHEAGLAGAFVVVERVE